MSRTVYYVTTTRFSTGVFADDSTAKTTEWRFTSKSAFLRAVEGWAGMDPTEFNVSIRTQIEDKDGRVLTEVVA